MPTSKPSGKLVVDATAIVSAIIGGKAMRIFDELDGVEFVTCPYTVKEVELYLPTLATKSGVAEDELSRTLDELPLTIYAESVYQHRLAEARQRIRDLNDVELLALALELQAPLWSNDTGFDTAGVERYPTGILLRFLPPSSEQPPTPSP